MTREVKLLIGIPGSGKSTWAKRESVRLDEEHITNAICSRDYVRFSMLKDSDDYFAHEKEVFEEWVKQINECMEAGIEAVFVDATHISPASRRKILSRLKPDPNTILSCEVFPISEELAAARNSQRTGRELVPADAIKNMHKGFSEPTVGEFKKANNYGFKSVHINYHKQER